MSKKSFPLSSARFFNPSSPFPFSHIYTFILTLNKHAKSLSSQFSIISLYCIYYQTFRLF